jgi:hypothetical protein
VQLPTKFEMVLNLKTASALGLAVPLSALTMVRAMAPIVNVVWLDAKHPFHPADNAADRGANHGPDRPSNAAAFIKALRGASGNPTLCRRGQRHGNRRNTRAYDKPLHSHQIFLPFFISSDLLLNRSHMAHQRPFCGGRLLTELIGAQ